MVVSMLCMYVYVCIFQLGMLTSWIVWIIFRWKKIPKRFHSQRNCQLGVVVAAVAITLITSFAPYVDWAVHFGGAIQVDILFVIILVLFMS